MKVLVSGSSGFIGSALTKFLAQRECEIVRLIRRGPNSGPNEICWNPDRGLISATDLEGFDAVVHLAGENLAQGRWTKRKKARIRDSRVLGTRLLADTAARLRSPPKVIATASAVGYYGNRGAECLTEASPAGSGFLADVCAQWEAAAQPAARAGIRLVHLRFGLVLDSDGGALAKMLPAFRAGFGGVLGTGEHYWSWIALEDVVRGIDCALRSENVTGPVNFVAPQPVTNREFTKTLGRLLARPTFMTVPRFALRMIFGQMADEALLASARVEPARLLAAGFAFRFPELRSALEHLLRIAGAN